jgi:predicted oxidoreductase (fatty acid repression mutant protein)
MAYDPKKTRTKQKDVETVVDEIFEEEVTPKTKEASTVEKAVKNDVIEKEDAKVIDIKDLQDQKTAQDDQEVDTPLIMQPQVWVALAASAIVALFIIKKRRK